MYLCILGFLYSSSDLRVRHFCRPPRRVSAVRSVPRPLITRLVDRVALWCVRRSTVNRTTKYCGCYVTLWSWRHLYQHPNVPVFSVNRATCRPRKSFSCFSFCLFCPIMPFCVMPCFFSVIFSFLFIRFFLLSCSFLWYLVKEWNGLAVNAVSESSV